MLRNQVLVDLVLQIFLVGLGFLHYGHGQVYLSLGTTIITTNNTVVLITDIGEDAPGGLPSLTCHTNLTRCCRNMDTGGQGGRGEWYYPDGREVQNNAVSMAAGEGFYRVRNAPQVIRLARRQQKDTIGPSSPTGFFCCVIPTSTEDMTFCANIVLCPPLPLLINGTISYTDPTLGEGSVATHSCDTGYMLSGGSNRTCEIRHELAIWSETTLVCQAVDCGPLIAPTNGTVILTNTTFGSTVTYSCDTGYTLNGGSTRTCQSGRTWSGAAPTCGAVSCGPPSPIFNGSPETPTNTTLGGTVTYSCAPGYTLSESATVTCMASGNWSRRPSCELITCSDLMLLPNGNISYSNGSDNIRPVGVIANYSCDTGYTLEGDITRTCQSEKTWNGSAPTCEVVSCGSPPSIGNGSINSSTGTTFGETTTYSCDSGYTLSGSATVTCRVNGSWETPPVCFLDTITTDPPKISSCQNLTWPGSQGMISYSGSEAMDNKPVGTIAIYNCSTGYTLSGDMTRICQNNGNWNGSDPTCDVTCPDLSALDNGAVVYSDPTIPRAENSTATYSCNTGSELTGMATLMCTSTGWDGNVPSCTAIHCSPLNILPSGNGNITYSTVTVEDLYNYGTTATYQCDSGYELTGGDTVRTCTSNQDSQWNGTAPVCLAICSDFNLTNGMITYSPNPTSRLQGTVAIHSCNDGYVLSGGVNRTCQSDRTWSIENITCEAICSDTLVLMNGNVSYSPDATPRLEGTVATHSCQNDYELSGVSNRTCLPDGSWSGVEVLCIMLMVSLTSMNDVPTLGEMYSLTCTATITGSATTPTFQWFHYSSDLTAGGDQRIISNGMSMSESFFVSTLSFNPLQQSHQGTYTCTVSVDGVSSNRTTSISLGVPMILVEVSPRSTTLMAGQNFSFTCTVTGPSLLNSTISFEWLKGDLPVGSNSSLTFKMLQLSDAGKYSCHVNVISSVLSSPLNSSSEQVNLNLQIPSPVVAISSSTMSSLAVDGTFILSCITTLPLSVVIDIPLMVTATWTGPGQFTTQERTGNISVEDSSYESQLMVSKAGNKGTYSCSVTLDDNLGSSFILPSSSTTRGVISCGSPPNITSGSPQTLTNTLHNGTVTYNCYDGYQQTGSATLICQASGSWSMSSLCTATCPDLDLTNGVISYSPDTTSRLEGTVATHSCVDGYVLSGGTERTCQSNRTWNGGNITCEAITCPPLPDHPNGSIIYSPDNTPHYPFGTQAMYVTVCPEGLERRGGDDVRTCISDGSRPNGTWNGTAPDCTVHVYLSLGSLMPMITTNNTEVLITNIGEGIPDGLPRLTCHTDLTECCRAGDHAGSEGLGRWYYPNGTMVQNSTKSIVAGGDFYIMRNAPQLIWLNRRDSANPLSPTGSYCCEIPTLGGERTLCAKIVVCLSLPPLTNGMISYFDPTLGVGSVATHSCDPGLYMVGGSNTRTCQSNGIWSGSIPTCGGTVPCTDEVLMNGWVSFNGGTNNSRPTGTVATYSCSNGFFLDGATSSICQTDGSWNSTVPNCGSIFCKEPTIEHGVIQYFNDADNTPPFDFNTTAIYICNEGYNQTMGDSVRICGNGKGVTGAWSGESPSCESIKCEELTPLNNGAIQYSVDTDQAPYSFSTIATYHCHEGFYLSGEVERTCGNGEGTVGHWNGTASTCEEIFCFGLGDSFMNGTITYSSNDNENTSFAFGTIAVHACVQGFYLSGEEERICADGYGTTGQWNGSAPTCEIVTCSPLADPPNGSISYFPNNDPPYLFGTQAMYATDCPEDLEREGDDMRTCTSDGSSPRGMWNGTAPYCTVHVYLSLGTTNITTNNTEILITDIGEDIPGHPPSLTCHTDLRNCCRKVDIGAQEGKGEWYYPNGTMVPNRAARQQLYRLRNAPQVVRLAHIHAEGTPPVRSPAGSYCCVIPTTTGERTFCVNIVVCPSLPPLTNGMISYSDPTLGVGSVATHRCVPNLTLNGESTRSCLNNGKWSGSVPTCVGMIPCPDLEDIPTNGNISYNGGSPNNRTTGTVATYSCNSGYFLAGTVNRICQANGLWKFTVPRCVPVCPNLTHANGVISYSPDTTPRLEGTVATHSCDVGYGLSGGTERTCQSDRTWSGENITCEDTSCSTLPAVENGMIIYSTTTSMSYNYGTVATYQCDFGYELTGGGTVRTCTGDGSSPVGQWNGTDLTCSVVSCGSPPSTNNRNPGIPTSTTFGGVVTYSCDTGFVLFGNATVECLASGNWSPLPMCSAVGVDIHVASTSLTVGEVVVISCTVTNVSANSIRLSRDNRNLAVIKSNTQLNVTISVNDSLHGSQFSCEAQLTGSSVTAYSNPIQVTVAVPPGVIHTEITEAAAPAEIGQSYSLLCRVLKNVSGLTETPTAQWFDSKGLVIEGNGAVSTGGQSTLTFSSLKTSHAGSYRCEGSVTSPALEQPLVTSETWELMVRIPNPSITLTRTKVNSKLYARDLVTFTCQVQMHGSVDTSVNVSLTWVRVFHEQQPEYLTTEYIFVDSSQESVPFIITREMIIENSSSLDRGVSCRSVLHSLEERYISSSEENSQTLTLDVIGIFLRLNNSIFPNSSSVLVSDLQPIQCHSDNSEANGQPEWRFPNGTPVREDGVIVATKQETHVTLSRADNTASVPLGQYCCMTQDARRRSHTLCVNIIGESKSNTSVSTGGVVAGVIILLLALLIICIVVIVVIVLRSRRSGKHVFSSFSLSGVKKKNLFSVKVDPLTPVDDHTDSLSIPMSQYTGVTTFNVEKEEVQEHSLQQGVTWTTSFYSTDFPAHVDKMHEERDKLFEIEYSSITKETLSPNNESQLSHNRIKNRFANVFPYDFNRVKLESVKDVLGSDYVNASYINGYMANTKYIAAQGPLPNTLEDFWRMIWENRLSTVVMLTRCYEDRKKCECYWPVKEEKPLELDCGIVVSVSSVVAFPNYTVRRMKVVNSTQDSSPSFEVTQFHYTTWPDHGVPSDGMSLIYFTRAVRNAHPLSDPKPLLVHCSAGVGRTGTFIVLDTMLNRMEQDGIVHIYDCVTHIRKQRVLLVQTLSQYIFLHDALKEFVTCGETEIQAHNLAAVVNKLKEVAKNDTDEGNASEEWQDNATGFERQFETLEQFSQPDGTEEYYCAQNEENEDKNRYSQILPSDANRVKLQFSTSGSDYINASFINGYQQRRAYIATQGPLEHTTGDFWRMVMENQCSCIVMLCTLREGEERASQRYWPKFQGDTEMYGDFTVTQKSFEAFGDYVIRKLAVSMTSSEASSSEKPSTVTQFHFTRWTEKDHPQNCTSILDVIQEVNSVQMATGNKPIVVMCNNGIGRTGAFITLHAQLEHLKIEGVIDVFQFIKSARRQREGLVNNAGLYTFCHEALAEYVDSFETYANFKELV